MPEICPICKQKVPFGLPTHMMAAHGPNSAEYQRRFAEGDTENPAKGRKPPRNKSKRRKPPGQKQLKYPRLSKLS